MDRCLAGRAMDRRQVCGADLVGATQLGISQINEICSICTICADRKVAHAPRATRRRSVARAAAAREAARLRCYDRYALGIPKKWKLLLDHPRRDPLDPSSSPPPAALVEPKSDSAWSGFLRQSGGVRPDRSEEHVSCTVSSIEGEHLSLCCWVD